MEADFTTWTIKDIWLAAQAAILMVLAEVETPLSGALEVALVAIVFAIGYRLAGQPTNEV